MKQIEKLEDTNTGLYSQKMDEYDGMQFPHYPQIPVQELAMSMPNGEPRNFTPKGVKLINDVHALSRMEYGHFPGIADGIDNAGKKAMLEDQRKNVSEQITRVLISVLYPNGGVPYGRRDPFMQTAIKLGRLDMDFGLRRNIRKLGMNRYEYEGSLLVDSGANRAVQKVIKSHFLPDPEQTKMLQDSLGTYMYLLLGNPDNHPQNRLLTNNKLAQSDNFISALLKVMTVPAYPKPVHPENTNIGLLNESQMLEGQKYEQAIERAAQFLYWLDKKAEEFKIDAGGRILLPTQNVFKSASVDEYDRRFMKMESVFAGQNARAANSLMSLPGVKDAKVYMGSVIVTYDSSERTPDLHKLFPGMNFYDGSNNFTGEYFNDKQHFLGLIGVDLNSRKRFDNDNVSNQERSDNYTQTARHELDHHALDMASYLLAHDPQRPVLSAYNAYNYNILNRKLGIPHQIRNRVDAYRSDAVMFIFSSGERFFAYKPIEEDIQEIEYQQAWIQESHSQFQDLHENWYSKVGKHYSHLTTQMESPTVSAVFGGDEGNPADIIARRLIASHMQVFKITHDMLEVNVSSQSYYPALFHWVHDLLVETTAYLSVAKTLVHAEKLVRRQLKKLYAKCPWLIEDIQKYKDTSFPNPKTREEYLDYVLFNPEDL